MRPRGALIAALVLLGLAACAAPCRRFVILSDLHPGTEERNYDELRAMTDHVIALKPAFAFVLGDIGNEAVPGMSEREIREIRDSFRKMRAAGIEIFPVMGNHDVHHRVEDIKVKWFCEQEPAPLNHLMAAPDGTAYRAFMKKGPYNYSFNRGGIHFVVIDSNIIKPRTNWETERINRELPRWEEHRRWMEEDLVAHKSNPNKYPAVVFLHQPEYATGDRGFKERPLYYVLAEGKDEHAVKAVFGGHWHYGENLKGARALGVEVYAAVLSILGNPDDQFLLAEIDDEGLKFKVLNSRTGLPQPSAVTYHPIPGRFGDLRN